MPGIAVDNMGDLLNATLREMPSTFTDTLRDTDAPLTRIFMEGMLKPGSGEGYEKRLRVMKSDLARFTNLYEFGNVRVKDVLAVQRTDYVHFERTMAFDEREKNMNSGAEQIVDLIDARRSDLYEDLVYLIEDSLASVPKSATDTKALRGPLYWLPTTVVGAAIDLVGGFNGTTARLGSTDVTTLGNVDRSNVFNTRARSWNANYSGEIDDNFLDNFRRGRTRTQFNSLPGLKGDKPINAKPNYLFTPHLIADQFEKRVNKGPDALQNDVNRFTDPTIAGIQIIRVPNWDNLAYLPCVAVRTAKWAARKLADRWMKEKPARNTDGSSDVWVVPVVGSCLLQCDDPRSGGFTISVNR